MKVFTKILLCVAAIIPASVAAQDSSYELSTNLQEAAPGDTITISWDTDANTITRDWIGLYRAGSSNGSYTDWTYTNGQTGSADFTISSPGTYEFRYLINNGYTSTAVSSPLTIANPASDEDTDSDTGDESETTYTLATDSTTYTVGEDIVIEWQTNASSNSRDWVGLFRTTDSNTAYRSWKYVDSLNGDTAFTINTPGTYEFRYFLNNGYTKTATSPVFTVAVSDNTGTDVEEDDNDESDSGNTGNDSEYTITTSDQNILTGETITASWSAIDLSISRNWVGVFEVGSSNTSYLAWTYAATETGSAEFTLNTPGTYELRYFLNNGYTLLDTSSPITVTAPENDDEPTTGTDSNQYSLEPNQTVYQRGDTVRVTWDVPDGAGFFRNWIGLYEPGAADTAYIEYEYVDIFSRTETFDLDQIGTYEFRFFTNNSYNKVATSEEIIVTNITGGQCVLDTDDITNYPAPDGPIIAFGDSITFGIGSTNGQDYVSELEDRLDVSIINAGVPGDTTRDALARLDDDVLSEDPSAVIVFLGGNDEIRRFYDRLSTNLADTVLRDELDELAGDLDYDWMSVPLIPRAETFENLEEIIEQIQDTGAVTILVGFDAAIYDSQIDDNYEAIAESTGSFFVPDIYDGIFARPQFMSDLVHPNNAGYDIVADRIEPAVACVI